MNNPWESIGDCVLAETVNAKRIRSDHPIDLFWAKDPTGEYCFLADNLSDLGDTKLPQLFGIELILAAGSNVNSFRVILRLRNSQLWQVFYVLCSDIVDASISARETDFVKIFLSRLNKWQSMLRLLSEQRLSLQEIQGLWGELMFMNKYLLNSFKNRQVVESWKGPLGAPQDYGICDDIIEVKTVQNTARHEVQISSLDQLDSHGGSLFLHVFAIGVVDESREGGLSLNDLVAQIRTSIGSENSVRDEFDLRLSKVGYVYDSAYDIPRFSIMCEDTYEVREEFPRICRSLVSSNVVSGTYSIYLGNSSKYLKKPCWMENGNE